MHDRRLEMFVKQHDFQVLALDNVKRVAILYVFVSISNVSQKSQKYIKCCNRQQCKDLEWRASIWNS